MREFRPYGSVRGALSNGRPYRDLSRMPALSDSVPLPYRFNHDAVGRAGEPREFPWFRTVPAMSAGFKLTKSPARRARRVYAALILPATALIFPGDARQIATAETTLTPAPSQNASV